MPSSNPLKSCIRSDYAYHLDYRTRWSDNDMYSHLNNSIYSFLFDSVINSYLITHCGLHPPTSPHIFLAVSTTSTFFASIAFPAVVELGLRVKRLGKSSITWEVGVFERGSEEVRCVGEFVHVCVERRTGRTVEEGIGGDVRRELERLIVSEGEERDVRKAKL